MRKSWYFILGFIIIFFAFVPLFLSNDVTTNKPYQVGILISGSERLTKLEGVKKGLQDLGFIEGIHIEYFVKNSNHDLAQMKKYAEELAQDNYDVIIAGGAIEATYLKKTEGSTPVVFLGVAAVTELDLVKNLQQPEGKMTGLDNGHIDLSAKRLQLLHLLLPDTKRVVVIYDENIDASLISLEKVEKTARDLQSVVISFSVSNEQQFEELKQFSFQKKDAVLVLPSYYLEKISKEMGQMGIEKNLPIFGVNSSDVDNGILLSYGVSYFDQGYQCANIISRVLNGQAPSEIPVETPDSIQLLVNGDTQEKIGVILSSIGQAYAEEVRNKN